MATPLIVNVVELLRWPGTTKDVVMSVAAADLEFGEARIADEPVDIALHLESLSNGVTVNGTTSATWLGECRRNGNAYLQEGPKGHCKIRILHCCWLNGECPCR